MNKPLIAIGAFLAALALTGCAASKSSNPLSPSVAGPIPGVDISAPKMLEPIAGTKIPVDKQPVTLLIENASSTGVRPLTYVFEISTDSAFTNKVFSRGAIAPGDAGRTSLKLPDPLATGRTYFWRAHAEDGANTGPDANAAAFDVFTPIVIEAPILTAPAPNSTVQSLRPSFTVTNAKHSGPVGAISYLIEVADSDSYANKVAAWTSSEQANQTVFNLSTDLTYSKVYYWHVRAFDPTTTGPWSLTQAFQVMAAPELPPPPPPSGGGGGGGGGRDGFNISTAVFWDNPSDFASWAPTAAITSIQFTGDAMLVDFDRRVGSGRWPDVGFGSGNLEYTLGMCVNLRGTWNCSATVQFWYGRDLAASGRPDEIASNWWYDARWGALMGYQPANGEIVGMYVGAGNLRDRGNVIVKERSNIVLLPFGGSYR
jgi:hypothetical protein